MADDVAVQQDNQPVVVDPAVVNAGEGTGEPSTQAVPDMGKTVEQLQAELQQAKRNYDELRSFNDRRFNEIQEKIAKSEKPPAPVIDEEWESRWEAEINENPGKKTKEFARGLAAELEAKHRKELEALRAEFNSRLMETDPEFRTRKAEVERIEKEYGVTREVAAKIVLKEFKATGPSAPPATPPPGRLTNDRGRQTSAPHVETVVFGDGEQTMLRYLGLDASKMAAELGKEAARANR